MIDLGMVAIGRNEGVRLRRCIESLSGRGMPVVYVDSGSTDDSVALARSMGVDVVELDMTRPFSAARARNAGFARLREMHPDLRFVMFLDGDCEIAPTWLDRARSEMEARPDAAVVCGRRREKFPEHSIYNRLVDLEWDTPVGEAIACGGDALMRADAFASVDGYDPTAIAGEEPELCQRLRSSGWTVWRIDAEMTAHDLAMTRFRQWWRRMYRCGYNGPDIQTRLPGKDQPFGHELARSRLWALHWPLALIIGTALAWFAFGPIAGLLVGLALLAIAPLRMLRIAAKARHRVDGWPTALAHGWFMVIGQFANVAGQAAYLVDRSRGRSGRLIEYKRAAEVARPQATTHSS
jgi:GT2 family glycosyltransferase